MTNCLLQLVTQSVEALPLGNGRIGAAWSLATLLAPNNSN